MTTTKPTPTLFTVPREALATLPWEPTPSGSRVENKIVYTTGRTVAGLLRLAPGAQEILHLHVDGEHHVWVLAGSIRIDDTDLPAESYVHVPARLAHMVTDGGSGSLLFYVFCPDEG